MRNEVSIYSWSRQMNHLPITVQRIRPFSKNSFLLETVVYF